MCDISNAEWIAILVIIGLFSYIFSIAYFMHRMKTRWIIGKIFFMILVTSILLYFLFYIVKPAC